MIIDQSLKEMFQANPPAPAEVDAPTPESHIIGTCREFIHQASRDECGTHHILATAALMSCCPCRWMNRSCFH